MIYTLINAATTVAAGPVGPGIRPVNNQDRQSLPLQAAAGNLLDPNLPITPPEKQFFQLTVAGTGAVSATAQIVGSNDGVNWVPYMQVTAGSGTSPQTGGASGTVPYPFYNAYLTAIAGTSAKATLTMSA